MNYQTMICDGNWFDKPLKNPTLERRTIIPRFWKNKYNGTSRTNR